MEKTVYACVLALSLTTATAVCADPALTIYNESFAVVRETVPLDLKAGTTDVHFAEVTAHLEPASVILRDPAGKAALRVVEQNYRFEPVSQPLLLSLFEGKTIAFLKEGHGAKPDEIVQGKIIRSGYFVPDPADQSYNRTTYDAGGPAGTSEGPIIEVDGKLRFSLPGEPLFPALTDDAILKPTLDWKVYTREPVKLDAELAYVTTGMDWQADYSVIAPEDGDTLELVGLVTINNQSGKNFDHAKVKLMAGNVNKVKDNNIAEADRVVVTGSNIPSAEEGAPPMVTVKAFDEYHLYSLPLPTSLRNHETKQVEFTRATNIPSRHVYVYDGFKVDTERYSGYRMDSIRSEAEYGTTGTTKVHVLREFKNSEENGLGIALPKGRLRFYRRDDDQLEFTGENTIDHTPKDETLSIYSGDAFDLVGSRRRTEFKVDGEAKTVDESFDITLRNHKKDPVEIRVVEHLYRWTDWKLTQQASSWNKVDAQTMDTRVSLKPDEEKTLSYTVQYSW